MTGCYSIRRKKSKRQGQRIKRARADCCILIHVQSVWQGHSLLLYCTQDTFQNMWSKSVSEEVFNAVFHNNKGTARYFGGQLLRSVWPHPVFRWGIWLHPSVLRQEPVIAERSGKSKWKPDEVLYENGGASSGFHFIPLCLIDITGIHVWWI